MQNVMGLVRTASDLPIRYVLNSHHHGGAPKSEARTKLYLADLGWNNTVSTTTWAQNVERYYDEIAAQ